MAEGAQGCPQQPGGRGNASLQVAEHSSFAAPSGSSQGSGVMGRGPGHLRAGGWGGAQAAPVSAPRLIRGGVCATVALTPDN